MKRSTLITLILGTALAVAPAAHAVVLSDGGGSNGGVSTVAPTTSMSPAELQALTIRGEALNQLYGNAVTRLSPEEFSSVVQSGGDRLTPQELAASVARGEALNAQYGTSVTIRPDILGGNGGEVGTPTVTGGDSFAWDTAGFGAATVLGIMLLGLASLTVTRRRQQPSF